MGGLGSGRSSGGRATTDSGLTLNLSKLHREGLLRPNCFQSGSITWTDTRTGEQNGSISYEAYLRQESGRVRLKYSTTQSDGERRESDYWIQLVTTPQPFGGRRWWFICPRTGERAAKLYLTKARSPSRRAQLTNSHTPANANRPITGLCDAL
jgi:hypothetical protein